MILFNMASVGSFEYVVYVKTMAGEIIPFEIPESLRDLYKVSNLRSQYVEYIEEKDEQEIDLGRVLFFDENLERVDESDLVVNRNTYQVVVSDFVVRLSFSRTVRLHHDYYNLPRKAHLHIENIDFNAYRYMYNEIEYVNRDDFMIGGNAFGRDEYLIHEDQDVDEDEKFRRVLEDYGLQPFEDNFDFRDLEEEDKSKLINAYLQVCLGLNMKIESYTYL